MWVEGLQRGLQLLGSARHVIGAEFREFVAGQPQNVCAGIQGYKIHMWCPSKYT